MPAEWRLVLELAKDFGLPAVVAFVVLWRIEPALRQLTKAVGELQTTTAIMLELIRQRSER